jgi:hypothetical protein
MFRRIDFMRPTSTDRTDTDHQVKSTDLMETEEGTPANAPFQSSSSEEDAGIVPPHTGRLGRVIDIDEGLDPHEVSMTDLEAESAPGSRIHSSEMSDLNAPGDVDIEDLDDDSLDDTNLPPDARLDALEP